MHEPMQKPYLMKTASNMQRIAGALDKKAAKICAVSGYDAFAAFYAKFALLADELPIEAIALFADLA